MKTVTEPNPIPITDFTKNVLTDFLELPFFEYGPFPFFLEKNETQKYVGNEPLTFHAPFLTCSQGVNLMDKVVSTNNGLKDKGILD